MTIARPTEDAVRNLVRRYVLDASPGAENRAVAAVAALPDETTALTVADTIQIACRKGV